MGRGPVVLEQELRAVEEGPDLRVGQGVDGEKVHERLA
jgi:hypothetical protein